MKQMYSLRDKSNTVKYGSVKNGKFVFSLITSIIFMITLCFGLVSCSSANDPSHEPMDGVVRDTSTTETFVETESPKPEIPKKNITICVDPGHGFEDGGTSSELLGTVLEKDITLAVANKLKVHLETYGFDVIMLHDGKTFPKASNDDGNNRFRPEERAAYANSMADRIDYYISVHCNAFDMPEVYGAEVYYVEDSVKGTVGDAEAAMTIAGQITSDFPEWKANAKTFPYYVIRYGHFPASLVEMGYVTNADDAAKMLDDKWQDDFAHSLAKGLHQFYSDDTTDDTTENQ